MGWTAKEAGMDFWQGQETFFFAVSTMALGPTLKIPSFSYYSFPSPIFLYLLRENVQGLPALYL
jgi:hypothetical protein